MHLHLPPNGEGLWLLLLAAWATCILAALRAEISPDEMHLQRSINVDQFLSCFMQACQGASCHAAQLLLVCSVQHSMPSTAGCKSIACQQTSNGKHTPLLQA